MDAISEKSSKVKDDGLSAMTASIFVMANMAGSGVLALPGAVAESGWIGLLLIIVFCAASGYLGTRLAACWVILEERFPEYRNGVRSPYAAIGYHAYGKPGRMLVSIANNVSLFGVSVVFLILCSSTLADLLKEITPNLTTCAWELIVAAALCPLTWFGTPKEFWWAGFAALLTTVIACLLIVVQCIIDSPESEPVYPSPTARSFFLAFGAILFSFGGASAFPTIQNDMKDKLQFSKSVTHGFIGLAILFLPVACAGYIVYGGQVQPNIFDSISDGTPKVIAQVLIAVHVFFAFLLVSNPIYQELEETLKVPNSFGWKRCAVRTMLLLLALFIAESVPSFGKVLDLVGGSTVSLLTFILPPLFYMKLVDMGDSKKNISTIPLHERIFMWEAIGVGIVGGVAATYSALLEIVGSNSFEQPCYL